MKRPANLLLDEDVLRNHRDFIASIHALKYVRDHFDEMMTCAGAVDGGMTPAQEALVLLKHLQPGNFEQMVFAHKHILEYVNRTLARDGRCPGDWLGIIDELGYCLYEMGLTYTNGEWVEDPDHYRRGRS